MTVPEVRRLLTRLVWTEDPNRLISSCLGRGGDGATKPKPANATYKRHLSHLQL